jgi:hypothetical protein
MKRLLSFVILAALAVVSFAAQSQSAPMSLSMVGVGPHGYDFLIGTWSCNNSAATTMGGPNSTTLTFTRSNAGSALLVRGTGKNFDVSSYLAYVSKTKTWWNPSAFADGGYENESTTDTGKKTVWTGSFLDAASGKTMQVRDTYTMPNLNKYIDLGQYMSAGTWKTQYNTTCTKS